MDNSMSCGMGLQNLESRCFFSIKLTKLNTPSLRLILWGIMS